jgi:hypothetical protein
LYNIRGKIANTGMGLPQILPFTPKGSALGEEQHEKEDYPWGVFSDRQISDLV